MEETEAEVKDIEDTGINSFTVFIKINVIQVQAISSL